MSAVNVLVPFVLHLAVALPSAGPAAAQFSGFSFNFGATFWGRISASGSGASIFGFIFGGFGAGGLAFAVGLVVGVGVAFLSAPPFVPV